MFVCNVRIRNANFLLSNPKWKHIFNCLPPPPIIPECRPGPASNVRVTCVSVYVSPLLDKTACCPWGGAGVGAVLQGNISPPGAGCCVLGRAAVHCTLLLGWRGGGATAAWSQWPGPAATHHRHHHNNAPPHTDHWANVAIPTRGHCCNVGHGSALTITGLRWLQLVGNKYLHFIWKQRHSLHLFWDCKKSTDVSLGFFCHKMLPGRNGVGWFSLLLNWENHPTPFLSENILWSTAQQNIFKSPFWCGVVAAPLTSFMIPFISLL